MKKLVLVFTVFSLFACKNETANDPVKPDETSSDSLIDIDAITETISPDETINLTTIETSFSL